MSRSLGAIGLQLAAGVLLGVACTPSYGETTEAETATTENTCPVGSLSCRCTTGGSCDAGLICASKYCVSIDPETGTSEVTTEVEPTSGSSTTGGMQCNPKGVGGTDPACTDPGAPYCDSGDCVSCASIDCAALSPSLPLCDPQSGKCAACLCDEAKPVCDPAAHTCSVCTDHGQCPDSACDLWTGACFPSDTTLWVDAADGCDEAGSGAASEPLCTLSTAFDRVAAGDPGKYAVRVRPGDYSVDESLRVPADFMVALVHATGTPGAPAVTIAAPDSAAIAVDNDGALLVDAVRLVNGGADGLTCAGAKAWLDRLTVAGAAGRGVAASDCALTMRRAVLFDNNITGVELIAGSLRLENAFVSGNGNSQSGEGGVYLGMAATLDAVYSTWVDNLGQAGTPFAVACDDDAGKEKVALRNSVAINKGLNTLCEGATVQHSAWSTDEASDGNLAVPFGDLAMYLAADDAQPGVYRATPGTQLVDLGMWKVGDPAIDFDGDERPAADNAPDFAGADRVAR